MNEIEDGSSKEITRLRAALAVATEWRTGEPPPEDQRVVLVVAVEDEREDVKGPRFDIEDVDVGSWGERIGWRFNDSDRPNRRVLYWLYFPPLPKGKP